MWCEAVFYVPRYGNDASDVNIYFVYYFLLFTTLFSLLAGHPPQVEATWSLRANHGGGYQYRLCSLGDNLTEACFKQTPIPFARKTWLLWGDGTRMAINGTYLSEGTEPANSTWAMNPLPFSDNATAPQFAPPCTETVDRHVNDTGRCSGRFPYVHSHDSHFLLFS